MKSLKEIDRWMDWKGGNKEVG